MLRTRGGVLLAPHSVFPCHVLLPRGCHAVLLLHPVALLLVVLVVAQLGLARVATAAAMVQVAVPADLGVAVVLVVVLLVVVVLEMRGGASSCNRRKCIYAYGHVALEETVPWA